MTAANHTVTGAVIAAAMPNPAIALPAALLSHLVLDMLPHYGVKTRTGRKFLYVLMTDLAVAASVLLSILLLQPANFLLLIVAGAIAASPDIIWLPYWLAELKGRPKKLSRLAKFLADIQWLERPWGIIIEAIWFVVFGYLLLRLSF